MRGNLSGGGGQDILPPSYALYDLRSYLIENYRNIRLFYFALSIIIALPIISIEKVVVLEGDSED